MTETCYIVLCLFSCRDGILPAEISRPAETRLGEDDVTYWPHHNTEKMSPVYICQNDKPMTSLALSTAHQVNTSLCQPHSLKG